MCSRWGRGRQVRPDALKENLPTWLDNACLYPGGLGDRLAESANCRLSRLDFACSVAGGFWWHIRCYRIATSQTTEAICRTDAGAPGVPSTRGPRVSICDSAGCFYFETFRTKCDLGL